MCDDVGDGGPVCNDEPRRGKREPDCCLELKENFTDAFQMEISRDGHLWRAYRKDMVEGMPSPCLFYTCAHPRCEKWMSVEEVRLHPSALLVSYEGEHSHTEASASPNASSRFVSHEPLHDLDQTWQSQHFLPLQRVHLAEYIEQFKPHYGIFLNHPCLIKYGVLDEGPTQFQVMPFPSPLQGLTQHRQEDEEEEEEEDLGNLLRFDPVHVAKTLQTFCSDPNLEIQNEGINLVPMQSIAAPYPNLQHHLQQSSSSLMVAVGDSNAGERDPEAMLDVAMVVN
ncbi:hypothetical protein HPP92_009910 [Vanilla planifolia]|uniref:WRKY domain-containing protein n=1 Tax=Vanilla planifolia TaxID=51239 RepID=A0A835V7F4_VANPL|nr:hypothetical protein HPP92_009910 [Vanilla planifolia]